MAAEILDNFVRGLDVRRPLYSMQPGSMYVCEDAHVTRGATVEVRKAFEEYATCVSTLGMSKKNGKPCVFSHGGRPLSLPAAVEFTQLNPGDAASLSQVDSVELFDGKLYVAALFSDGDEHHFYDGTRVTSWFDGRARGSFDISTGSAGAANKISSIKVNGVEVLGGDVLWATSHSNTAALVAAAISAYGSAPEYDAVSVGASVIVKAAASAGTTPNGYVIQVTVGGDVTVSTPTLMANGSVTTTTYTPGTFAKTHGTKMHSTSGSLLHFSGIDGPTGWNPVENDGAGIINLSNNVAGSETLKSMETYLGLLAVFAKGAIQIWSMAADPLNNALIQTIQDYGTRASRSVKSFTENDVFFLDEQMIRALRPSSMLANYAVIRDPAAPIADLVSAQVLATASATVDRALTFIEPLDHRLWVSIGDKVFVYTHFEEENIKAWSVYNPGFTITDAVSINKSLYVRGDNNKIYVYGGADGVTYDDTSPTIVLPAVYGRTPIRDKSFEAIDFGLSGQWQVWLYETPDDYTAGNGTEVCVITGPTYWKPEQGIPGLSTHAVFKLIGQESGRKELVNVAVQYEQDDAP